MHRRTARSLTAAVLTAAFIPAILGGAGTANAAEMTFVGYGYLPSDAHADAVRQMNAYSSTCEELGTVYSPAGSEHYWKATLTADC